MAVLKRFAASGVRSKNHPPAEAPKNRLGDRPLWWNPTQASLEGSSLESKSKDAGFQETWHLRVTDTAGTQTLHLRFHLLRSRNGFQRNCEVWATLLQRLPGTSDVQKHSLKQVFDLTEFRTSESPEVSSGAQSGTPPFLTFGSSFLSATASQGSLQSKGRKLSWRLHWQPVGEAEEFNRVPVGLQNSFQAATLAPELSVSGAVELDGMTWNFEKAPGLREHHGGLSLPDSWSWAHAWLHRADVTAEHSSSTRSEGYLEASLIRSKLVGPLRTPSLSAFRIHYQGQDYRFNTLWESLRAKTELKRHQWNFQVERGDLRFVGKFSADLKDFAGHCFEDTDGTLAYAVETGLARFELVVYRKGKLEVRFHTPSGAQLEIAHRKPDPYVPLLG